MRVGIGYDIHRLRRGRPLVLGGVKIPYPKGLAGHSDGDALVHAVIDAVLGAAGAGDIGDLFPDSDRRHKNASSFGFVRRVRAMLGRKKLKVAHIDATIVAEAPRLYNYKAAMRRNLAAAFGVPAASVGVKAKTHEGLGAIGKGQAIACLAVASLVPLKGKR